MSSFDRRTLLASFTALAACGFTPTYGPGAGQSKLHGTIAIDDPIDRNSFNFVSQFEKRLGRPAAPKYLLSYNLNSRRHGVGVTPQQEITRYHIVGDVKYSLQHMESGKVLTAGKIDNFTSYTVGEIDVSTVPPQTSSTISTLAANRDADERLMIILADQLVSRLLATSKVWIK